MLLSLSGYDELLISRLEPPLVRRLKLACLWAAIGIALCGLSAVLLATRYSSAWPVVVLLGLLVVTALGSLQAFAQASIHAGDIKAGPDLTAQHVSRWIVAALLSIICLLFTQPLLMAVMPTNAVEEEALATQIKAALDQQAAAEKTSEINRQIAEASQILSRFPPTLQSPQSAQSASNAAPVAGETSKPAAVIASAAQNRKALLIGNDQYISADPLNGAVSDVTKMREVLTDLGFQVALVTNATRSEMEVALHNYLQTLQPGDISFFHFSGHGFQWRKNNYLAPVDLNPSAIDTSPQSQPLNLIVEAIGRRSPLSSIVVIDACRNNLHTDNSSEGLAVVEAPPNSYVAMATSAGKVASESLSKAGTSNGLFTEALLKRIKEPVNLDEVFMAVRSDVARESKKQGAEPQQTVTSHALSSPVFLAGTPKDLPPTAKDPLTAGSKLNKQEAVKPQAATPVANEQNIATYSPIKTQNSRELCAVGTGGTQANAAIQRQRYTECVNARLAQLKDDLNSQASSNPQSSEEAAGVFSATPIVRSHVFTVYRSIWTHPVSAIAVTAALFCVLAGGMLWRASMTQAHDLYAAELHKESSGLVEVEARVAFEQRASKFPFAPSEELLRRRILDRIESEDAGTTNVAISDLFAHFEAPPSDPPQPVEEVAEA